MWNLLFIVILALGIGIRWYWAEQKEGMHQDEVASFSLAESDDGAYAQPLYSPGERSRVMTGRDLKSYYFIHDASLTGVLDDLRTMHGRMYVHDHTNFYYSILRVFFVGTDTTDVKSIMTRGIVLNLLFFAASFFVLYRLLSLYYAARPLLILVAMACFALMSGAVSDALFIRPYELQMLTVLLLAWWLSNVSLSIDAGTWRWSLRNFVVTALALFGVLWTGYFMVFLVVIFGFFVLLKLWRVGQLKAGIGYFSAAALAAIGLCRIAYSGYFIGFQGDGRIADKLLSDGAIDRMWNSILSWKSLLLHYTMSEYVLVLLVIAAALGWRRAERLPFVVFPAFVFTLVVMLLAPYFSNRYIVAVTPLLLLSIPAVLSWVRQFWIRHVLAVIVVAIYVSMSVQECNIEYLYRKPDELQLLADKTGQIRIVQRQIWQLRSLIPFLSDDNVYEIAQNVDFQSYAPGDIVVFSPRFFEEPSVFGSEQFEPCGIYAYYTFYRVKEQPESAIGSFGNN